jgi:hypothetical protein
MIEFTPDPAENRKVGIAHQNRNVGRCAWWAVPTLHAYENHYDSQCLP